MNNYTVLDCEIYPNYTLFSFKDIKDDKIFNFELKNPTDKFTPEQINNLKTILTSKTTFGFNSNNYDIPIILSALNGSTCDNLYKLSKYIIASGLAGWQILKDFKINNNIKYEHVDIKEVLPGIGSLKLYGARVHFKKLQELPYDPTKSLSNYQKEEIKKYCVNDLNLTETLFKKIYKQITLRYELGKIYKTDLLSKSDAQIAEACLKIDLNKIHKFVNFKNNVNFDDFTAEFSEFIKFKDPKLKQLLINLQTHKFKIKGKSEVEVPTFLKDKILIGDSKYKVGIGGLHSMEKSKLYKADENNLLVSVDVVSYYPNIILNNNFYPPQLTKDFLRLYRNFVNARIIARKNKDAIKSLMYKILINGIFGKLGNQYSIFCSFKNLINVTLTGQLCLLMLIESLEKNKINVVSANTDGIFAYFDKEQELMFNNICRTWEEKTNLELDKINYKSLYSRDVNNYFAVSDDDKIKGKGVFSKSSLSKNPNGEICYKAAIAYLTNSVPIMDTLQSCKNIEDFIFVRTVNGGATYKRIYIGKVVRWIYVRKGDYIKYKHNDNKVAGAANCFPIKDIKHNVNYLKFVDYQIYKNETIKIIRSLGFSYIA